MTAMQGGYDRVEGALCRDEGTLKDTVGARRLGFRGMFRRSRGWSDMAEMQRERPHGTWSMLTHARTQGNQSKPFWWLKQSLNPTLESDTFCIVLDALAQLVALVSTPQTLCSTYSTKTLVENTC